MKFFVFGLISSGKLYSLSTEKPAAVSSSSANFCAQKRFFLFQYPQMSKVASMVQQTNSELCACRILIKSLGPSTPDTYPRHPRSKKYSPWLTLYFTFRLTSYNSG